MLVRQSTVVNFLGERHCCSRGEYSTKGSQYRATPRISLPRRDSFFFSTKVLPEWKRSRDISGHNCDEFAGFSFAVDSMWTRTLFPGRWRVVEGRPKDYLGNAVEQCDIELGR